MKARMI